MRKPSEKAMRVARWALNTGYRYGVYPNPRKTIDDYIEEIARRLDEEYPQEDNWTNEMLKHSDPPKER